MAVNRLLRDQLADALQHWARGEWTREQMHEIARTIFHQLEDATDDPSPQDEACKSIAHLLEKRYYPDNGDPKWTKRFWQEMRQYFTFLRSDIIRNKCVSEERTYAIKRRLYLLWLDISIILVIVSIWIFGFYGLLVWPLTSLPMWAIVCFSFFVGPSTRTYPYPTKSQRSKYDHLADQPPAFPDFKTARRCHTKSKRVSAKKIILYMVVSPIVLVIVPLGIMCYAALALILMGVAGIFWPFISKQWYRETVFIELSSNENPTPCDQCRKIMFESKVSLMIEIKHSVPMTALHQCPFCGTYWCGHQTLSNRNVQEQFLTEPRPDIA